MPRHFNDDQTIHDAIAAIRRHLTAPGTNRPLEPYPEQVRGARTLLRGAVVEMATGEGKTLTAAIAAACLARRSPVHIATANDYLAQRDAAMLAPVFADLGLRTGCVTPRTAPAERRHQYASDIVYAPLSEFGFDYLRDQLVTRADDRVHARDLGALIVDEADLLLIDDARTPLIISRPVYEPAGPDLGALSVIARDLITQQRGRIAGKLAHLTRLPDDSFDTAVVATQVRRGAPRDPDVLRLFRERPSLLGAVEEAERQLRNASAWMLDDGLLFSLDDRAQTAYFTDDGQALIESRTGPLFDRPQVSADTLAALHNLLLAHALFERDRDYLVQNGRVVLIEASTGRAAENRRYMQGLHAAIEVKELGAVQQETETLAQISVQQFVRLYRTRAGMTGTAMHAAREFARVYEMPVARIPRHRPNRRVDLPPRLYRTSAEVDRAVLDDIIEAHTFGRPVLVGTQDVARSDRLSVALHERGIPHNLLNAREHTREAAIVAGAGVFGAVTIATNMAGRGTDIVPERDLENQLVERAVAELRARLHVLGPDGDIVVECASPHALARLAEALRSDGQDVTLSVETRQQERRLLLRPRHEDKEPTGQSGDDRPDAAIIPPHRSRLSFGLGLYVIGVEPHAGRRLDDQLRGRSGRQGDEGVTRLYASLEDPAIRRYGAEPRRTAAQRALNGVPYLEGDAARRVITDAQRRAERMHEGQRRVLFALDQVIERQRKAVLKAYDRALAAGDLDRLVAGFVPEVASGEVARRPADPVMAALWLTDLTRRYRLPRESLSGLVRDTRGNEPPADAARATARPRPGAQSREAAELAALLNVRLTRGRAEAGERWPELVRMALLRAARELWSVHVELVDLLQRQAPVQFSFLPAPVEISFAKEANNRYAEYVWAVRAETLHTLLTLPQPYERLGGAEIRPNLSPSAMQLVGMIEQTGADETARAPLPTYISHRA